MKTQAFLVSTSTSEISLILQPEQRMKLFIGFHLSHRGAFGFVFCEHDKFRSSLIRVAFRQEGRDLLGIPKVTDIILAQDTSHIVQACFD